MTQYQPDESSLAALQQPSCNSGAAGCSARCGRWAISRPRCCAGQFYDCADRGLARPRQAQAWLRQSARAELIAFRQDNRPGQARSIETCRCRARRADQNAPPIGQHPLRLPVERAAKRRSMVQGFTCHCAKGPGAVQAAGQEITRRGKGVQPGAAFCRQILFDRAPSRNPNWGGLSTELQVSSAAGFYRRNVFGDERSYIRRRHSCDGTASGAVRMKCACHPRGSRTRVPRSLATTTPTCEASFPDPAVQSALKWPEVR